MLTSFNSLFSIISPLLNAAYAYDREVINSHQPTFLQQELRTVENAWYWGLGDVMGSLKQLVLSISRQRHGWDEKNPAFMSVQRAWGNAVHFLKMYGEVDEAMAMPSTPLPEWLCISLFFQGTYSIQATGSNISLQQMQDAKLSSAQWAEVAWQVAGANPEAEWIPIENPQYKGGFSLLEIWLYDGRIGEVNYNKSLAKSEGERRGLLQTFMTHYPCVIAPLFPQQ